MGVLIVLHRWLGVACCLLVTMWFASGIVMHFVPFPRLTDAERLSDLPPIDFRRINSGPGDALRASRLEPPSHIRLLQRSDGPIYVVSDETRIIALRASDLSSAAVATEALAMAVAADYAHGRGLTGSVPTVVKLSDYDQWTMQGEYDAFRPLYRVALNDPNSMFHL
jgi:hypothetical protein